MKYSICYDIVDNKTRNRVVRVLMGYSQRVQKSIFEGFLTREELETLQGKLKEVVDEQEDVVRIYPLCESCEGKMILLGRSIQVETQDFIII